MSNLIDFGRYPIDKRDSDEYHQLVREARNHLLKYAIFRISNFITAEGIKSMQDQCIDIVNSNDIRKSQRGTVLNCYGTKGDESLPANHPANTLFPRRFGSIVNYMIPSTDAVRQVYDDPHLIQFVTDVMDVPILYHSDDPGQGLTINVMDKGEGFHWHFDKNASAVTLGIQQPQGGGKFEYAAYITRNNYPAIQKVVGEAYSQAEEKFEDERSNSTTTAVDIEEGQLVFFCGGESIHRVSPVVGAVPRIVAALPFQTKPSPCITPEASKLNMRGSDRDLPLTSSSHLY